MLVRMSIRPSMPHVLAHPCLLPHRPCMHVCARVRMQGRNIGLSAITALTASTFIVLERDNRGIGEGFGVSGPLLCLDPDWGPDPSYLIRVLHCPGARQPRHR